MDAAEVVFSENGYHSANIHEICARANVGIGTFYSHFDHKKQLLERVMRDRASTVPQVLTSDDVADFDTLLSKLRATVDEPVSAGLWRAWHEAVLEHGDLAHVHVEWRKEVLAGFADVIERARDRSSYKGERLDADIVAWILLTLYRELAIHDRAGAPEIEDVARLTQDLIFGNSPRRSAPPAGTRPRLATSRARR